MKDLISRQKAIDTIKKHLKRTDVPFSYPGIIEAIREWLNDLPSAQSESKTGKWIEAYDPFNRISYRCPVCGWEAHLCEYDVVGMNYCPNCGNPIGGETE